jgi:cytochrome b-561 domain-containing protein 2
MAEAVMMMMSQDNIIASKLSRQGRVRLHWILQAGAAASIFTGFLVIVINKNIHNKNHFKSWHSILGLVFLVSVGITNSGGVITLYSFRFFYKQKSELQLKLTYLPLLPGSFIHNY